jgi:hypothetical protein
LRALSGHSAGRIDPRVRWGRQLRSPQRLDGGDAEDLGWLTGRFRIVAPEAMMRMMVKATGGGGQCE